MNKRLCLLSTAAAIGMIGVFALGHVAQSANNVADVFAVTRKDATMPSDTRRVWIINNDDWWADNNYWVYAWNANGSYGSAESSKVTMVLPANGNPNGYYHGLGYVDISLSGATSSLKVRVVNNEWGDWGQTVALELPEFGTSADVIYMNSGGTWDSGENRNDRNASFGSAQMYTVAQMSILLSGFNTCSTANTFGYNAYPQLNKDFFTNTSSDILGSEETLTDYDYQEYYDAGKDYSKINKDKTSKIADKIEALEYWYTLNN